MSNSFDLLQGNQHLKVAVAGSINEETLPNIINHQPETVIIGSGITGAQKPRDTAAHFQRMVKHNGFL
ncbi:beta/alpha barrel domain-containing protein [Salicibibacter halophilus]|uniref:hypothetical protein n=1 Tax=Salicibibacter halophilus TaxID=2502791 RepID=UPI001D047C7E|nr:hypothetical protein [Salicibibacter halophilus]